MTTIVVALLASGALVQVEVVDEEHHVEVRLQTDPAEPAFQVRAAPSGVFVMDLYDTHLKAAPIAPRPRTDLVRTVAVNQIGRHVRLTIQTGSGVGCRPREVRGQVVVRCKSIYAAGTVWYPERDDPQASGDDYELELGFTLWNEQPTGEVTSDTDTTDLEKDLALDTGVNGGFHASLAHPVRWLPDLDVAFTPLSVSGSQRLDEPLTFEGVTFREGLVVDTGLALDTWDLTLFWRPVRLDRWFQLRLGLVARNLNGLVFVRARVASTSSELEISVPVIPLGYLALSTQPLDWLSMRVDVRAVVFGESRWIDVTGMLRVWLGRNVFAGVGYRWQELVLKDQGAADADAVVQGIAGEGGMRF